MTDGDAAALAGMDTVSGLWDIRLAYQEINKSRDYIAQFAVNIPASAIVSGTFDTARIPPLDASKIAAGTLDAARIPTLAIDTKTTGNLPTSRLAGTISGASITGSIDVADAGGTIRGAALVTPGNLTAAGVRSTIITSGIQQVYAATDGRIGVTSSSRRFKQNITPAERRTAALMALTVVNFRYRAEVRELGSDAPIQRGVIAEQLHDLGLTEYVVYVDDKPFSVHYERLILDVIPVVQDHEARLAVLEQESE